ncbi:DUF779 domain-containing protein [Streptomyces noursei]|nr:DUF779 domain-containing protein [Streptomyces noursei]QRX89681.1 DUF779 domain-containing protein [Streptomyces noursei]
MWYLRGGAPDVQFGHVAGGTPFWMSADQHVYWSHTHRTVDVVTDLDCGLPLGTPQGIGFLLRSRLLTNHELSTTS